MFSSVTNRFIVTIIHCHVGTIPLAIVVWLCYRNVQFPAVSVRRNGNLILSVRTVYQPRQLFNIHN